MGFLRHLLQIEMTIFLFRKGIYHGDEQGF
jgi:hypothetical protein